MSELRSSLLTVLRVVIVLPVVIVGAIALVVLIAAGAVVMKVAPSFELWPRTKDPAPADTRPPLTEDYITAALAYDTRDQAAGRVVPYPGTCICCPGEIAQFGEPDLWCLAEHHRPSAYISLPEIAKQERTCRQPAPRT